MSQVVSLHPWKRPQHLESAHNQLLIDGVNTIDLVERYGSPLFVYSESKLRDNARDIPGPPRGGPRPPGGLLGAARPPPGGGGGGFRGRGPGPPRGGPKALLA